MKQTSCIFLGFLLCFAFGHAKVEKEKGQVKAEEQRQEPEPLPPPPPPPALPPKGDEVPTFYDRPLVSTHTDGLGRHVGVDIPGIYKMDLSHGFQGTGLDINVLSGLVRVGLDRTQDPFTGRRFGPISVRVAGIPIFGGNHNY